MLHTNSMNKGKKVSNIFLSVLLVLVWCIILFSTFILWVVSDVFSHLFNGTLIYFVSFIYALAFILPILFRKRLEKHFSLPLSFLVFSIFSVILASVVLVGSRSYISSFSQEKWNNNEDLRVYMIDDLERKHQITGMTKAEITELLGNPEFIFDEEEIYEYFIGVNMIDPIVYRIKYENDIAKETEVFEH